MSIVSIKKSIKHWERMIRWAKKQDPQKEAYYTEMARHLKEDWYSGSCALCTSYLKTNVYSESHCFSCPIYVIGECCEGENDCETKECSVWRGVQNSENWDEWCKNAEDMLFMLKFLEAFYPTWEKDYAD